MHQPVLSVTRELFPLIEVGASCFDHYCASQPYNKVLRKLVSYTTSTGVNSGCPIPIDFLFKLSSHHL